MTQAELTMSMKSQDQRSEPRLPCDRLFRYTMTDRPSAGLIIAQMSDFSVNGIGFVAEQPMAAGDRFLAELHEEAEELVEYEVRHCRRGEDRRYQVGARRTGVCCFRRKTKIH